MDQSVKWALWVLVILVALYMLWKYLQYEDCINSVMKMPYMTRDIAKMYC